MNDLEAHNYRLDSIGKHQVKVVYQGLSNELHDLRTRFTELENYTDANLSAQAKTISDWVEPLNMQMQYQQGYLYMLSILISGRLNSSTTELAKSGEQIYHELQQSLSLIDNIQSTIHEKYKN